MPERELLPVLVERPELPSEWDYDVSVKSVKAKVYKAKNLTGELLCELWTAREMLSAQGRRTDLGTNVPKLRTWNDYCQDIGSTKRTANRWLKPMTKQLVGEQQQMLEAVVIYDDVVTSLDALVVSEKKFATIYADPPWSYGNQGTRAATGNHYSGMTVDEICDMPVPEILMDDAHLHLWTTNAFLFEAKRVMEAWGFEYKSILLWCKPQMGIGNYWRVCHEFLLFGMKGKLPMLDARTRLRSWYTEDRTRHSAKPAKFRSLVEQVSPAPRLEMFAREAHDGWAAFGNEIIGAEMWGK